MTTLAELSKTLTPEQARRAKERARKAGRRYPNAYDNMRSAGKITKAGQANPGTPEWKRKAILATNAAGVVAAPAAIGLAVRSARSNEGGTPRSLAGMAADKLERSGQRAYSRAYGNPTTGTTTRPPAKPAGRRRVAAARALRKPIKALNTKAGRRGKIGALVAGGSMVGLQGAQSIGDALAAHENMGRKPRARAAAAIAAQRKGKVEKLAAPASRAARGAYAQAGKKASRKAAMEAYHAAGKKVGLKGRLMPNPTQTKALALGGAGYVGYKGKGAYDKQRRRQYDPYYGGY